MRKPVTATTVLLLLVLVPSGVLAWLGYQSADAFDSAAATRLRDELEKAGQEMAVEGPRLTRTVEKDLEVRVRKAAARLAKRLPLVDSVAAGAAMRREVYKHLDVYDVASIRIVDARGRSVLPREHAPADAHGSDDVPSQAGLLADLRRRADRAYFGAGGLAGSLAVWSAARKQFRSDALRVLADVEQARLRSRGDADGNAAAREAHRLEETWGRPALIRAGRPMFLLWLSAAQADADHAFRIREAYEEGWADATPLTREERARADRIGNFQSSAMDIEGDNPFANVMPDARPAYSAPLPGGARLVVRVHALALFNTYASALKGSFADERFEVGPYIHGWPEKWRGAGLHSEDGLPRAVDVRVALPGSMAGGVVLLHKDWERVRSKRSFRRLGITLGVVCLFLVTALGLFLIRRAIRRERQARRMRDEFIANVTHEVRTPLTSVLLHSQMMADAEAPDDRRREHAEVVQAQGRRLAALVDDMLDFARLERGTRTLEAVPVDLGAACREAVAPYLVLAEQDGVDVLCEVEGEEVAAMADPAALARILSNLVGNAWKHGRPARGGGDGRILITAKEDDEYQVVEVRDDGPGIPPAERERVFERFGRGRRSARIEGSGIGLALSRDLAAAMGGSLAVEDDGDETIFRLRLPTVPELDAAWEE